MAAPPFPWLLAFQHDQLLVSQKLSIARRLVEWFVTRHGRDPGDLHSA